MIIYLFYIIDHYYLTFAYFILYVVKYEARLEALFSKSDKVEFTIEEGKFHTSNLYYTWIFSKVDMHEFFVEN